MGKVHQSLSLEGSRRRLKVSKLTSRNDGFNELSGLGLKNFQRFFLSI